jgi:hypothetical protein
MTQSFDEEVVPAGTETASGTEPVPETETVPRPETFSGTGMVPEGGAVLETETVPEVMVAEFSSLTTAYCWVITEDLVAGYDGAVPSGVGTYGPSAAGLGDLHEALCAGRWFRLAHDGGAACAVGRMYDPSGNNDRTPLDEAGLETWGATVIEYRQGGQWEPA